MTIGSAEADQAGARPMSVNLSDAELAEASNCRRTVSVCTPSKRCKAGTLRLLPLKLTPIGAHTYLRRRPTGSVLSFLQLRTNDLT